MRRRLSRAAILAVGLAIAADARPCAAQGTRSHPGSTQDFLFGSPRGSVTIRGSWVFARAGSDLFDFVTDQLTLDDKDFDAPAIGGEIAIALSSRLEALGGLEFSAAQSPSEYRHLVDNNRLPITQETRLKNLHISGSVKVALTPRGRSISRLAWVPRGLTPYVGGGLGAVYFDFNQRGDFVDFADLSVFTDVFQSTGWAPSVHAFGGADIQMYRKLFLKLEGRYLWASGELERDFIDFDPIDLAGFRMTVGASVLF